MLLLCLHLGWTPVRAEEDDPSLWERSAPEVSSATTDRTTLTIHNDGTVPFGVQIVWKGGIWSSRIPGGDSRTADIDGGGRVDCLLTIGDHSVKDSIEVPPNRGTTWRVEYTGEPPAASRPAALSPYEAPASFEISGDEFKDYEKKTDEEKIQILEKALAGEYRGHEKMTEVLAVLHNNRGLSLGTDEDWNGALYHLRRAAQLAPNDRTVKRNLAVILHNHAVKLMDSEGFPAAEREILAAIDTARGLGPEVEKPITESYADILTRQGINDAEKGWADVAASRLRHALDLKPDSVVAWVRLGEIHYDRHELAEAADCYRRAVALLPRDDLEERLQRIERELAVSGEFTTSEVGRFRISFQGDENETLARDVRNILRHAYRDVGRIFHSYPKTEIAVVIYNSGQFRHVTQLHGWAGAVYDGKIRLRVDSADKRDRDSMLSRLREQVYHEYTHALIHTITGGARVPVWLHEGLAQYAEDQSAPSAEENLRLAALALHGDLPSMSRLAAPFAGMADSGQASLAYLQSKLFVRYLIDHEGLSRIRKLLDLLADGTPTGKAAGSAFGRPLEELESQWREGLS
jgi:tetratricopeptide (TPR) repeat protein